MSYDLFVWCDPPAQNADAALELIERVSEGEDLTSLEAQPRFKAFLDELFGEHPPLESVDAGTDVWSFTADRSDRHALLSIQWAAAERIAKRIVTLCDRHGVRCFDPQTGEIFQPGGPPPPLSQAGRSSEIIGSTATPTELFWFIITKFRNDRDISGHFLGHAAARVAKALETGTGSDAVQDIAALLRVAALDGCDLDATVSEAIHDATAVVTVVPNQDTSTRHQVHMCRIGRAWKVHFPTG